MAVVVDDADAKGDDVAVMQMETVPDLWLTSVLEAVTEVREHALRVADGLSDEQLESGLVATEAVRRAVDGLELVLVAEVGRRGEERGPDGRYRDVRLPEGDIADMAPDAVALATGIGPTEAGRRCAVASRSTTDLAPLAALVAEGRLSRRALEQVHKHTRDTTPETTSAIVEHLLAPRRGSPDSVRIVDMEPHEVAKTCRRLISRLDPDLMQARADANRATRLDVRTEPGPVGTTWLSALLPSEVAAAIKAAVDAAGQRWREEDPQMPIGTARAMGLADLALCGSEVSAEVRLGVPVIASAVSRLTVAPFVDPSCPVCRGERETLFEDLLEDELTSREAHHSHLRIVTGEGPDQVDVLSEEWMGEEVTTQVLAHGGSGAGRATGTPGERWVSGTTIPGVGFVPPDVVAAIVGRFDTRVGRALLDARTGTLLETSTSSYAIPRAQREFVATRDGTCRMWGCDRPAQSRRLGWATDVDHATPWPEGETSPANLSGLCRHHHRVKHSPRWSHRLHEDGTTEWITPGGVPAFTLPVHAVDEGEEDSSPLTGTSSNDGGDAGDGVPAAASSPLAGTKPPF